MSRTTNPSRKTRLSMTTVLLAVGIALAAGSPASAAEASPPTVPEAGQSRPLAGAWTFHGFFPDPITCLLAGNASGYSYTCNFVFVGWTLWLLDN